ncbi:MAG: hypothetical protein ACFFFC_15090 [Candidatus Thorarchaeota archaeon]
MGLFWKVFLRYQGFAALRGRFKNKKYTINPYNSDIDNGILMESK